MFGDGGQLVAIVVGASVALFALVAIALTLAIKSLRAYLKRRGPLPPSATTRRRN